MDLTEKQIAYFWERVDKSGGLDACWNWTFGCSSNGYGNVNYNTKQWGTHILALTLTEGPPPDALRNIALHSCKQNRKCCNPAHLSWGTFSKNNGEDKIRDGTATIGELHGTAKLTEKQVLEIRAKYVPWKYSLSKLAAEYNVHLTAIAYIINRKSWQHI
tara:strand:+ start:228 stop:707 length:480 start_codon:yes stop_codon:yes gene_type:complete